MPGKETIMADDTLARMFWSRIQKSGEAPAPQGKRAGGGEAAFAIFSAGCTTIPVYPSYTPEQLAYIGGDSGAKTLIVEDPAQLAKALEARGKMDTLEQIVVIQGYEGRERSVHTWEELRRLGRDNAERLKSLLAGRGTSGRPGGNAPN